MLNGNIPTRRDTSRMLSIVGEQEQARCNNQILMWNELYMGTIEMYMDRRSVVTLARAAKEQCWIASCSVQPFRLASWRES